jgi:pyridoxal phosphate enzyme (YggS family)
VSDGCDASDDRTAARRDDISARLERVRERVATASLAAGRAPDDVTLIVVTKYFTASDVRILHGLGVRDVGENRHQEGAGKREECADLQLRWHFIGHLQSNKAAAVAAWADVVQSVDRPRLLPGLHRTAHEHDRPLDVLVQVSLDPPGTGDGRSGIEPEDAPALAREVAATPLLSLRGVMGVAPRGGGAAAAFARLAEVSARVRAEVPSATWMSAGMSGDLEAAIAAGATHVRVGSAVLGNRPVHR